MGEAMSNHLIFGQIYVRILYENVIGNIYLYNII